MNVQQASLPLLETEFEAVRNHLPPSTWKYVSNLLLEYPVVVRVVPHRATKLGDYRPPRLDECCHRITVNDDLNIYAFLVTLLHELAHLRVAACMLWNQETSPAWSRMEERIRGDPKASDRQVNGAW